MRFYLIAFSIILLCVWTGAKQKWVLGVRVVGGQKTTYLKWKEYYKNGDTVVVKKNTKPGPEPLSIQKYDRTVPLTQNESLAVVTRTNKRK